MKAAKHLRISQPSLSSQIKVLEGALNIKLFEKVGRSNQLTRAGFVIYGYCQRMFELSEEMSEVILQRVPSLTRRIHIGVSDEVERSFVVEAVSLFLKRQGSEMSPRVTIVAGTQGQLAERLKFRELDIVVTELSMVDSELITLAKAETPVVLTHSSHCKVKLKTKGKKDLDSIKDFLNGEIAQWVMPSPRFKLRSEIDHFFEANNLKGRVVIESDVIASLIRSVADGVGWGFFPVLYIARELRERSVRVFGPSKGFWTYSLCLVCNHQSHNDQIIQAFAQSFKEVCTSSKSIRIS